MIDGDARTAVLALMAEARLSEDELKLRVEQAVDPAYWARLVPTLTVAGAGANAVLEQESPAAGTLADVAARIESRGYFQLTPLLSARDMARMADGVERVRQAGWPAAFAFVFDEFWQVTRTPSLVRLLTTVLGPGYRQNSNVWCHCVASTSGSNGWRPHIDGPNKPNRLSIWIPLTDATLDNGCMYVIPQDRLPESLICPTHDASVTWKDVRTALQNARALPAPAGSVLGWRFDVMHWGSMSSRAAHPRISLAVEFVSAAAIVAHDEEPLVDGAGALPGLRQRLHGIGKGIRMYEQFEPLLIRFRDLAERLVDG